MALLSSSAPQLCSVNGDWNERKLNLVVLLCIYSWCKMHSNTEGFHSVLVCSYNLLHFALLLLGWWYQPSFAFCKTYSHYLLFLSHWFLLLFWTHKHVHSHDDEHLLILHFYRSLHPLPLWSVTSVNTFIMTLQAQFLVSGHIAKLILYLIIIRVANHVTDKTVSFQSGLPLAHHIWPYDTKAAMVMVKTFRLRLHCGLLRPVSQSLQIILCHSHVCVWIWNRNIRHSLKRPVVMPWQPPVARERWVVPHWPRNARKCEFESLSSCWTWVRL